MSHNAYLGCFSISGTRPFSVPKEVAGTTRIDGLERCEGCIHHNQNTGPAPALRHTRVRDHVADVCRHFQRELLIPLPTTKPCKAF
jgi:hypothetical protein